MIGPDKRKMDRYKLNLPATICFKSNNGSKTVTAAKYKTKNVCAGGAFFITDNPYKIDTKVDVNMLITFHDNMNNKVIKSDVFLGGVVTRVGDEGMAVEFGRNYKLTPAD